MYKIVLLMILPFFVFSGDYTIEELDQESFGNFNRPFNALQEEDKKKVKNSLRKKYQLLELAKKENLDKSKEFINVMQAIRNNHLVRYYLEKKRRSFKISQKEIQEYYNKHKNAYLRAHVYTILRLKKSEIQNYIDILSKTEKNRQLNKFKEIAKEYSLHASKLQNGDLGYISKNTMVKPFGDIAFSLKEGEFNKKPFKTTLGWHLVYVQDYKYIPLSELKQYIIAKLQEEKFQKWYQSFLSSK